MLSTVLSSILDPGTRRQVAAEAYRIISDDGILLIYDIRLPSPANPNVCRIGKKELRTLLPDAGRTETVLHYAAAARGQKPVPRLARAFTGRSQASGRFAATICPS